MTTVAGSLPFRASWSQDTKQKREFSPCKAFRAVASGKRPDVSSGAAFNMQRRSTDIDGGRLGGGAIRRKSRRHKDGMQLRRARYLALRDVEHGAQASINILAALAVAVRIDTNRPELFQSNGCLRSYMLVRR